MNIKVSQDYYGADKSTADRDSVSRKDDVATRHETAGGLSKVAARTCVMTRSAE